MEGTVQGDYKNAAGVYESVKNYYGRVLSSTKDLKTSACCTANRPHKIIRDALAQCAPPPPSHLWPWCRFYLLFLWRSSAQGAGRDHESLLRMRHAAALWH
jgi:hypothetical protein